MMKPNAKIKLFLMLIAFLASFVLKNHSEMVDTVYGDEILRDGILGGGVLDDPRPMGAEGVTIKSESPVMENAAAAAKGSGGTASGTKELSPLEENGVKRDVLVMNLMGHLPGARHKALLPAVSIVGLPGGGMPAKVEEEKGEEISREEVEKIEKIRNEFETLSAAHAECPAKIADLETKKMAEAAKEEEEKREEKRIKRTLYGRVWSDFSKFLKEYDLNDSSQYEEVKEEVDEIIKEEVADFLEEEFDELGTQALLNLDFSETKIPRELKSLDRTIRELKKKGRRLNRKSVSGSEEQEQKERDLTSLAIQLYAAKRMKSRIESQVEKRFRAIRDSLVAVQTQADNIKAQEERMVAMAKMFENADPLTKMLLAEMFGDPLGGGAPAPAPQGFSIDVGGTPGGGLRIGLGAQGAESGFAFDFSKQPEDPFSGLFPGYNNGGSNPYGGFNPAFDPRRFGGSYWGN